MINIDAQESNSFNNMGNTDQQEPNSFNDTDNINQEKLLNENKKVLQRVTNMVNNGNVSKALQYMIFILL